MDTKPYRVLSKQELFSFPLLVMIVLFLLPLYAYSYECEDLVLEKLISQSNLLKEDLDKLAPVLGQFRDISTKIGRRIYNGYEIVLILYQHLNELKTQRELSKEHMSRPEHIQALRKMHGKKIPGFEQYNKRRKEHEFSSEERKKRLLEFFTSGLSKRKFVQKRGMTRRILDGDLKEFKDELSQEYHSWLAFQATNPNYNKIFISKEDQEIYLNLLENTNLTVTKLSHKIKVDTSTIYSWINALDSKRREVIFAALKIKYGHKDHFSKERIIEILTDIFTEKKTISKAASIDGITEQTIYYWIAKQGSSCKGYLDWRAKHPVYTPPVRDLKKIKNILNKIAQKRMTVQEASRELEVSTSTIYTWIESPPKFLDEEV